MQIFLYSALARRAILIITFTFHKNASTSLWSNGRRAQIAAIDLFVVLLNFDVVYIPCPLNRI